ncbi:hypothetical protein [Hyphomonas sp.]|uniref:hypothetical protein n=1 Tax=Hyphomonas sp. TaxID=87 RepID=UPI0025B8CA38|nr:hypothetical protein [Hyphomonas sp.]MBI1400821.1 hypothetical protein [Hyphomonas sp.]
MKLAPSLHGEPPALEYMTVMTVEKVLRKVRAFARLVIGNRAQGDELVEDALTLYLSTDPDPDQADESYAYLVRAVCRVLRTSGAVPRLPIDLDAEFAPLLGLALDTREIAALHLGAGLGANDIAHLLEITAEETTAGLDAARAALGAVVFDSQMPTY